MALAPCSLFSLWYNICELWNYVPEGIETLKVYRRKIHKISESIMKSNLYSLILAAVRNYSWHESSHRFLHQDKDLFLLMYISIFYYISLHYSPCFSPLCHIFSKEKEGSGTNVLILYKSVWSPFILRLWLRMQSSFLNNDSPCEWSRFTFKSSNCWWGVGNRQLLQ